MARLRGRARKGERLRAGIPHGHWKTTTFVAGLRLDGIAAPMVLDGPINRDAFQAYVDQVLVPDLQPGDVVVMDNLSSHKGPAVRRGPGDIIHPGQPAGPQGRGSPWKASRLIGPSRTIGAAIPSRRRPATKVVVFQ
jgi:DDE superfamily endonuclease